jgi:FixJ family two-component response regulator
MITEPPCDALPSMLSPLISIVDDDASLLRALSRLLRATGFTVQAFGSGEHFLESGRRGPPHCLVLDVHLAGMSGFDLHERLIACGALLPVIFMTAHDDDATRQRARRAGAVDYFRKPFGDAALIAAIQRAISPRAV